MHVDSAENQGLVIIRDMRIGRLICSTFSNPVF